MKIYVINLARDTDRRESATRQLQKTGLEYEFFDARTASNGWTDHFDSYDELAYLVNTGRTATPGEIGCYASHRAMWQLSVGTQQPIMIMEDDFQLSDDFSEAVRQCAQLIAQYGFIRLQTERRGKRRPVRRSGPFQLVYYTKMPHSLMCYAIAPDVAQAFINNSRCLDAPVDVMIKKIWEHRQRLYGLMPYVVSENPISEQTSISGRVKSRKPLAVKWKRFLTKVGWGVKRRLFTFNYRPPSQ